MYALRISKICFQISVLLKGRYIFFEVWVTERITRSDMIRNQILRENSRNPKFVLKRNSQKENYYRMDRTRIPRREEQNYKRTGKTRKRMILSHSSDSEEGRKLHGNKRNGILREDRRI
jgi:hypothetical protein